MKNRKIFTSIFSLAFVAVLTLAGAGSADAQKRFDPKATGTESELRSVAGATQDLLNFVKQAQFIEQDANAPAIEHKKLQDLGRRIKDGTGSFRGSLQGFIAKIKNANQWNEQFDAEFAESITSPRVKAFIKRVGGARKALTDAEAALNSLGQDVDATVNESKRAAHFTGESVFVNASFSSGGAAKVRLKCVLLGVGVAAAEIGRLKLTAENLDNLFDSNKCGGGSATPAT